MVTTSPRRIAACISLDLGLNSRGFQANGGYFRPQRKNMSTPTCGMRADRFIATIQPRLGRTASRTLFRHEKRLARNSRSRWRLGVEVLVNHALTFNCVNEPISPVPARPPADAWDLFISISSAVPSGRGHPLDQRPPPSWLTCWMLWNTFGLGGPSTSRNPAAPF